MSTEERVSKEEFRAALTPTTLRAMQMVQAALMMGVPSFLLVVLFFSSQHRSPAPGESGDAGLLRMLSFAHLAVAGGCWAVAPLLYGAQFGARALGRSTAEEDGPAGNNAAGVALFAIRRALILRLALLDGAALFGLVVCFLGAINGVLREQPVYWLNALSALIFLGFGVLSFPTRDRVEAIFETRFSR